jgi:hypothetical protein
VSGEARDSLVLRQTGDFVTVVFRAELADVLLELLFEAGPQRETEVCLKSGDALRSGELSVGVGVSVLESSVPDLGVIIAGPALLPVLRTLPDILARNLQAVNQLR